MCRPPQQRVHHWRDQHLHHLCVQWTRLAPWECEFPFPGRLISTFLYVYGRACRCGTASGTTSAFSRRLLIHIYMYIDIYVYIHTYMYIHTCIYMYIYINI